jgi:hypothetical protein
MTQRLPRLCAVSARRSIQLPPTVQSPLRPLACRGTQVGEWSIRTVVGASVERRVRRRVKCVPTEQVATIAQNAIATRKARLAVIPALRSSSNLPIRGEYVVRYRFTSHRSTSRRSRSPKAGSNRLTLRAEIATIRRREIVRRATPFAEIDTVGFRSNVGGEAEERGVLR